MTAPIIFQQPGWGESVQKGLAPLLQAIQQTQQRKLQEQQLATQQAVAQANIAQAAQQTEALRLSNEQTQRTAKGEQESAKIIQEMLEQGVKPEDFTSEMISQHMSKLKTPEGIMAYMRAVPALTDVLGAPTKVKKAELEVSGMEQTQALNAVTLEQRQAMLPLIRDFVDNPDKPFNVENLSQGQAIAAAALDLSGVMIAQLNARIQRRDFDTQERMLARTASMKVWDAALATYSDQLLLRPDNPPDLADIIDQTSRAMLDMSGKDLRKAVRGSMRYLGVQEEGFIEIGALAPKQRGALSPALQRAFDSLPLEARATALRLVERKDIDISDLEVLADALGVDVSVASRVRNLITRLRGQKIRPYTPSQEEVRILDKITAKVGVSPATNPGTGSNTLSRR